MQIILTQDVEHVGAAGQLVNVKPGYARNYLIPQGMALTATKYNMRKLEHDKAAIAARVAKQRGEAEALANRINGMTLQFERLVGEADKMFGSVTSRDLSQQLEVAGIMVDHKKIDLSDAIRAVGKYECDVKLGAGVKASLKFWVVGKEE